MPPLAGFGVGAADQIFAAFELRPDHKAAIGVGAFLGFPVRRVTLLGIDELTLLVAVNFSKFHDFNILMDLSLQLLMLYLYSIFNSFNT
ncbi:MAG: hypothetical protein WBD33_24655 [Xanthobacteraceae bacterium]